MDNVMTLRSKLGVIVDTTVENYITRLHFLFLEDYRECVKLVSLVPTIKIESKIFPHIIGNLSQQRTAIEEHGSIIQRFTWIEVSLCVWHSEVLLGSLKEFLSQPLLNSWILPVNLSLLGDELSVLNLLNFLLFESLEVRSEILRLLLISDPHEGLALIIGVSASLLFSFGLLEGGLILHSVLFIQRVVDVWCDLGGRFRFFHLE
jgi:hypothetical protein